MSLFRVELGGLGKRRLCSGLTLKTDRAPPPIGVQGWRRAVEGCLVDHVTVSAGPFPAVLITGCYNPHGGAIALGPQLSTPTICHVTSSRFPTLSLESAI